MSQEGMRGDLQSRLVSDSREMGSTTAATQAAPAGLSYSKGKPPPKSQPGVVSSCLELTQGGKEGRVQEMWPPQLTFTAFQQ